jgi:putative ABC transport system permease protein
MIADRVPLARRLRRLVWPVSIDTEITEELAAHIELQTRRYIAAGMSEHDAIAAARERFGSIDVIRDECRVIRNDMETDMRRAELRQELRMDAEYTVRMLRRNPLFTFVGVVTMALGIGANTAIFSVLNAVLLRSLPYRFADRTMVVWNNNSRSTLALTAVAAPEYFDMKAGLRSFDAVAAITRQPSSLVGEGGEPERIMAYVVTPNMFDLLGASPSLGRAFGGDDGTPGATRVTVISHALWTRRFGGDAKVIGKAVNVAGFLRTIVGVMPPEVRFPDAPLNFLREPADLWLPSTWEQSRGGSRGNQVLAVVVRRSANATPAQAAADLAAMSARFRAEFPNRYASESAKGWSLIAIPLREQMVGSVRTALFVISAAVGLILLIACVNVANLLLARGATRQREIAVRMALGAARARLVRQLLTESTILAILGGALGIVLAWAGVRLIVRLDGGEIPRLAETSVDGMVLLYSMGLTLVAGLIVGIVPALQQSAGNVRGALGEAPRGSSSGRAGGRLRRALVAAQVAMALLVLVAAGLLGRSFVALQGVRPGFSSADVFTFQLNPPVSRYDSASKLIALYEQVRSATAAIPGVSEVSAVYPLPMGSDHWSGTFTVEGEPTGPTVPLPHAEYAVAMPGYFHAARIPLIAGRDFETTDRPATPAVAVVDEELARKHWPNQSAINKRINADAQPGEWATVIGVVGHVHNVGPQSEGEPQLYLPYLQHAARTMSVVARTTAPISSIAAPVRAAIKSLDADLPVAKLGSMDDIVFRALSKQRFNTLLLGVFAATALILASIGLYGVMAFLVSQRTREIGIRMALGGEAASIRRMVLREGIVICTVGLLIGGAASLAVSRTLSGLLFGVAPNDPATYTAIGLLLLAVGAAASYGPARRATRVSPMVALHE